MVIYLEKTIMCHTHWNCQKKHTHTLMHMKILWQFFVCVCAFFLTFIHQLLKRKYEENFPPLIRMLYFISFERDFEEYTSKYDTHTYTYGFSKTGTKATGKKLTEIHFCHDKRQANIICGCFRFYFSVCLSMPSQKLCTCTCLMIIAD